VLAGSSQLAEKPWTAHPKLEGEDADESFVGLVLRQWLQLDTALSTPFE
jgi:hypothetical protein